MRPSWSEEYSQTRQPEDTFLYQEDLPQFIRNLVEIAPCAHVSQCCVLAVVIVAVGILVSLTSTASDITQSRQSTWEVQPTSTREKLPRLLVGKLLRDYKKSGLDPSAASIDNRSFD